MVRNPPANSGDIRDVGYNPGSGRFPGGGHVNTLQYSCLENPWWATVHMVAQSLSQLKRLVMLAILQMPFKHPSGYMKSALELGIQE